MKNKTVTVRIDEKTIERLNYYRSSDELIELSQSEFIIQAINEKCEKMRSLRGGGINLNIPNPNFIFSIDSQKNKSREILLNSVNELNSNCPGLDFGLEHILSFATQRLITDSNSHKDKLENNFYKDLDFENKINGIKKIDESSLSMDLGLCNMPTENIEKIFDLVDENLKTDENSFNSNLSKFRRLLRNELLRREEI